MEPLYVALKEAGLMYKGRIDQTEVDLILLEKFERGRATVDTRTFETLFSDVKENPTYNTLSGSHTFALKGTTYTMTAEEMGYQKYFDEWKALGILN
ncbi:hypothetical protein [Priestia koreensis]|uniref:hypothetical protein n=1 Tax=Priestia koreensis TaxID=284581 RepID=UPI00203BDE96|nr:hypothetical protein [Priestia koreensis]MCM3006084.1 hypothetical protein [Priestia koreensis]